ncbi:hypothetical protein BDV18DRAFT_156531 [Aspergillus unguis]
MSTVVTAKAAAKYPLTKRNLEIHTSLELGATGSGSTGSITSWVGQVITDEHTPFICGTTKITAATMIQLQRDAERAELKQDQGVDERDIYRPEQEAVQTPITAAMAMANVDRYRNTTGTQRPFMHLSSPFERLLSPNAPEPTNFSGPLLGRVEIQYGSLADLEESSDMARARVNRAGQQGAGK